MKRLATKTRLGLAAVLLGVAFVQLASRLRPHSAAPAVSGKSGVQALQGRASLIQGYGQLPLSFEANFGQTDARVKFLSRGSGYTLFLTGDEAVLALRSQESEVKSQNGEKRPWSIVSRQLRRTTDSVARTMDVLDSPPSTPNSELSRPLAPSGPYLAPEYVRLQLVGANSNFKVMGLDELPGKSNYFIGNDPKKWRTNVPNYARVSYQGVYPGVDLVYYGNQGQLEYDFVVAPGADPKVIALSVEAGLSRHDMDGDVKPALRIDTNGDLAINTEGGEVRFRKPVIYQPANSSEAADNSKFTIQHSALIDGHYILTSGNRVSFEIAGYDQSRALVIDPVLGYSTYLGGSGDDSGTAIAMDASGNAYVTGSTASVDFPTATPLRASLAPSGNNCVVRSQFGSRTVPCPDAFVTKLDATGTAVLYSTYLGGSNSDSAYGIAVDSSGNAYVAGSTDSTDFPTTAGAFDATCGTGSGCNVDANGNVHPDAFVAKLNPEGDMLVYSTYLGGKTAGAFANGIAVDTAGNAYVAGSTASTDFPTTNPFQKALGGANATNAFVTELNTAGSALVYSTYLGGSTSDTASGIAVDSSGNAYVAGSTTSTNFPTTTGAHDTICGTDGACNPDANGNKQPDAFVTKFDLSGSKLVYSTYLGGSGADAGSGIAVDSSGNAYVAGTTSSRDFPTQNPFQAALGGGSDGFVTKLNPTGSGLIYSTYLGGSSIDGALGVAVDAPGGAYVTGQTSSSDFPIASPVQAAIIGGNVVAFVAKLSPTGSALVYSTYLGGSAVFGDSGTGIAVDSSGNAFVTGITFSTDFPVTLGSFLNAGGGGSCFTGGRSFIRVRPCSDAFVAKIGTSDAPGFAVGTASLNFDIQAVSTSVTRTLNLLDAGSQPLTITSITISGTNADDFSDTTTCAVSPATVAGGANCAVSVTFSPQTLGTKAATLVITDAAAGSPHSIPLTGVSATPPTAVLSPTSFAFGSVAVFNASSPQTLTLTNTGGAPLKISTYNITVGFGLGSPGTCLTSFPATLNGGASCTLDVTFIPQTSGPISGTLSFVDNAAGSPQTVALSGTGTADFMIDDNGVGLLSVAPGGTTSFNVNITPLGGFNQAVALTCSGAPPLATCTVSPTSVTPDGTNPKTALVTVTTTARTMLVPRWPQGPHSSPLPGTPSQWLWLMALSMLLVSAGTARPTTTRLAHPRRARSTLALTLLMVLAWAACGGGASHQPGTPAGTYTLTITGTSGSLSHGVNQTLAVGP